MRNLHKSIKFHLALICGFSLMACDKYLDVTPKGYTLLTTVTNYDQWLNDRELYNLSSFDQLTSPSDVVDMASIATPATSSTELAYTWVAQYAPNSAALWQEHYQAVSSYNSVILGVEEATGGTEQQKKTLRSEALLGRALEYFYLVNEYGKSYDSATAATDPGVPIVISDDVAQKTPPRSPVKEVYDFIIADINAALPDLPRENGTNRFRGSKAAGYSLLARVYFYARNYSKAADYAQQALDETVGQSLLDYTAMSAVTGIPPLAIRPDAIYARAVWGNREPAIQHLKRFNTNDKRLLFFYTNLGNYTFPNRGLVRYAFGGLSGSTNYDNTGTSVQEMVLILAEAAARRNDLTEALKQLDDLRKKRIPAANYVPYESTDQEEVLKFVLEERELEFPFNGLRWFDMRRLDLEGRMPAVERYNGAGVLIATLAPKSPRYTFQVPELVMQFNPGMEQNK